MSFRPLSSPTLFTWFIFLKTISSLYLGFSLVEELFKKKFLEFFKLSPRFPFLLFTSLTILWFSRQRAHFQNLAYYVQPSTLAGWVRLT